MVPNIVKCGNLLSRNTPECKLYCFRISFGFKVSGVCGVNVTEEHDCVQFIFDHMQKEANALVKFCIQLDRCSEDKVLQVLTDLYSPTDTLVQLQQQFYGRNQIPGESLQDSALALMEKLTDYSQAC